MYEMREYIEEQTRYKMSDDLMERMGEPFYEIELHCTLDTETGVVEILSAE